MELKELKNQSLVFYESVINKLFPNQEDRVLGTLVYNSGSKLKFLANVIYMDNNGTLFLANDYFRTMGITHFDRSLGVSGGRMIDNWSADDEIQYSEKIAPKSVIDQLKQLELSESCYSKEVIEEKIKFLLENIKDDNEENPETLSGIKELNENLSNYFRLCHSGEKPNTEKEEDEYQYNIVLKGEEDSLRPLYQLKDKSLIDGIQVVKAQNESPKVILYNESNPSIGLEKLKRENLGEFVDLILDQSFYGATL